MPTPGGRQEWGDMLGMLERKYEAVEDAERDVTYYRETLVRGHNIVEDGHEASTCSRGKCFPTRA